MDQLHPVRILRRERNGVYSTDGKVAGIKAPRDIRARQDLPYMGGCFDQGTDMGMEHLAEVMSGADGVDHGQLACDLVPLPSVQVKGGRPSLVDHDGGDEVGASG